MPFTRTQIILWSIRLVALAIVAAAVTLPYARAENGLQPSLLAFLQKFLYLRDHKTLAPMLLLLGVLLTLCFVWPTFKPVAYATLAVGGLWAFLMLAIPAGMAHVRPVIGWWVGQGLLVVEGVLLLIALRL